MVAAAQLALNGVIEERNVGQRTTLDVLNAQADVITAQINLASSERDVVGGELCHPFGDRPPVGAIASGLQVAEYQPEEHYNAVKDKWIGLQDARRPLSLASPHRRGFWHANGIGLRAYRLGRRPIDACEAVISLNC